MGTRSKVLSLRGKGYDEATPSFAQFLVTPPQPWPSLQAQWQLTRQSDTCLIQFWGITWAPGEGNWQRAAGSGKRTPLPGQQVGVIWLELSSQSCAL